MAALGTDLRAKIEAYLLGRLPDDEQTRIEALLFEDDDVFEAIKDAEDDLIDRYLAGELVPADREAFERTFATSASRQQRIALARLLSQGVASGGPVPEPAPPAGIEPRHRRLARASATRRAGIAAAAALAAALVVGFAWRTWFATPGDQRPSSGETMRSSGGSVATLPLDRIALRRSDGSIPRLRVPEGTTVIHLEPELEAPIRGARYEVTLRRVEGHVAWQGTVPADDGQRRLTVVVPARLVGPGDYVLRVAVPGSPPEDSAEYPFRLVTRD
jgi:hypothetical protein